MPNEETKKEKCQLGKSEEKTGAQLWWLLIFHNIFCIIFIRYISF